MAIVVQDVRDRYPEFSNVTDFPDARIQTFITKGEGELNEGEWADQYDEGMLAFVAHFLARATSMANSGGSIGSIGPVTSKSVGDVSVSFASVVGSNPSAQEAFWNSTPYGQEYWRLIQLFGVGMLVV